MIPIISQEIEEDYETDGINEYTVVRGFINDNIVYEDRVDIRNSGSYYFENVRALYEEAQNAIYEFIGSPMRREAGSLIIEAPCIPSPTEGNYSIHMTSEGYGIYELLADEGRM